MSTHETHIAAARQRLSSLAGIAAKTEATERRILAAATDRLGKVEADIARLAPRVNLDDSAADAYQAAILERGQLAMVITRANEALNPSDEVPFL